MPLLVKDAYSLLCSKIKDEMENARVLIDANILLSDFFFRYPEYARTAGLPDDRAKAADERRALVNLSLQHLSNYEGLRPFVTLFTVLRINSVLCDLRLPTAVVKEEMAYLLNNFEILETSQGDFQLALQQTSQSSDNTAPQWDTEDELLHHLCIKSEIDYIFTAKLKSDTPASGPKWINPEQLLQLSLSKK